MAQEHSYHFAICTTRRHAGTDYQCTEMKTDDHTLAFTNKKDGKVTITGRVVVFADGKRRTVTVSGTDAKGKKFTSTSAYDKY